MWTDGLAVDKWKNTNEAQNILRGLGLNVSASVVLRVVSVLQNEAEMSFYDLYAHGKKNDGTKRSPICGKGTAYKIKSLYEDGRLNPYLACFQPDEIAPPWYENETDKKSCPLTTGFRDLDEVIGGLYPWDLVVLGGAAIRR